MFVQSEKFVTEHQGKINDISIYGQESNQTTWRLAKMNLAIRGIDSSQVKWNNEGTNFSDCTNMPPEPQQGSSTRPL
jgi:type I restriction enzyme M protein